MVTGEYLKYSAYIFLLYILTLESTQVSGIIRQLIAIWTPSPAKSKISFFSITTEMSLLLMYVLKYFFEIYKYVF